MAAKYVQANIMMESRDAGRSPSTSASAHANSNAKIAVLYYDCGTFMDIKRVLPGILAVALLFASVPWRSRASASLGGQDTKASVDGTVVSLPSGAAIRYANVELFSGKAKTAAYSVLTDSEGRFSLSGPAPGEYRLVASKTGYSVPEIACGGSDVRNGGTIDLAAGQNIAGVRLELLAPAAIEGTVYDANGEALAWASLEALRLVANGGKRSFATMGFAETDDHGRYRLFHLKPGEYYVSVLRVSSLEHPAESDTKGQATEVKGFRPVYYGDTVDARAATTVQLKAGEEFSGADISVRPSEVLRVRGRVLNGVTGEAMKGAITFFQRLDPEVKSNGSGGASFVENGDDGRYTQSNLTPGRYAAIAFTATPIDHRQVGGFREIELSNSSLDDVDIRVYPGEDIRGTLEMDDGGKSPSGDLKVSLYGSVQMPLRASNGEVKPDGSFVISDALPGTYDVRVHGLPEDYFVKSARMGTVDVLENGVRIGGGGSGAALVVRLSAAAARLDGTVEETEGKAACRGDVVLIPEGARRMREENYFPAKIDSSGHFAIHGIPAGDYRAFAWEDAQSVAYREPAVIEAIEGSGTRVHLDEGDKQTLKLQLIAAAGKSP